MLNSKNFIVGHTTLLHVPDQSPGGYGFMKYKNSEQNLQDDLICGNKSVLLTDKYFFLAVYADVM